MWVASSARDFALEGARVPPFQSPSPTMWSFPNFLPAVPGKGPKPNCSLRFLLDTVLNFR